MDIRIARGHEIKYWSVHKNEPYTRSAKMLDLFDNSILFKGECRIVADVGCGPKSGIFHSCNYDIMYAVDPLWGDYKKLGLAEMQKGVNPIQDYADTFRLPQLADVIVSVNALDHSGSLENSISNIMHNIRDKGEFCLHVHMRTKKQLNKGHHMIIKESQIDKILAPFEISKRIYAKCPIENKPYKTYVSVVRKNAR